MGRKSKAKKKPSTTCACTYEPSISFQAEALAGDGSGNLKSTQTKSIAESNQSASKQSHSNDQKIDVIDEILIQVKKLYEFEDGYDFESGLREHFHRFPARYSSDVNARVDDVFIHITLLELAKEANGPVFHTAPFHWLDLDDVDDVKNSHMHEIHFSTIDRPKLFAQLTSLLLNIGLNIKETRWYSTTDGYSLILFLVDDWPQGNEELEIALEEQISKSNACSVDYDNTRGPLRALLDRLNTLTDSSPRCVVVPTDDVDVWEININQLKLGKRYKGIYFNQEVAVKVLKPERFNADMLTEFTQEIFIMRKIRHKNVVQFIGACTQSPILCIITEFMSRGSLYDFLHKLNSKFDLPTLLKVAIDVSKGMDCLHQNGIIHRDLKSSNLLMDENEIVKVADFGIARVHSHSREMTPEIGTYLWMAPEVIEHKTYNQKADVFSFGLVLWELVTGEIPYSKLTPLQAALGVVQRGLRPSIPEDTHPKLAILIKDCWHQDPAMRPSFCDIMLALQDIASEVGPKQRPSTD